MNAFTNRIADTVMVGGGAVYLEYLPIDLEGWALTLSLLAAAIYYSVSAYVRWKNRNKEE